MAAISPGVSGPRKKPKKPTPTTKAYRYESFTDRIAKIQIDPVHEVQRARIVDNHNDLSTSYFRSSLDKWSELNLSRTFTSFLNKASPLSETLPQLLHHTDRIYALLVEHIERREELALEPLLDLVAQLAHDLGRVFEKYFCQTAELVTRVASLVQDPDILKACFTCLAWMFKYMSRVLIQDLRPLLKIMVPYMSSKKEYMRRFSAESLAFLVRLAANKTATLTKNITYLFEPLDEVDSKTGDSYYTAALMTLMTKSVNGIEYTLHRCSQDFMRCTIQVFTQSSTALQERLEGVIEGVVISLVHETDAAGFQPLYELVESKAQDCKDESVAVKKLLLKLLQLVCATQRGTRIHNWTPAITAADLFLNNEDGMFSQIQHKELDLMLLCAAIFLYAPLDQLLPHHTRLLDRITSNFSPVVFFTFCEVVAETKLQRFQDLLLPRLRSYIITYWSSSESEICCLLTQLHQNSAISKDPAHSCYLRLPAKWEHVALRTMQTARSPKGIHASTALYFQLIRNCRFPSDQDRIVILRDLLRDVVSEILRSPIQALALDTRLALGWSFQEYLNLDKDISSSTVSEMHLNIVVQDKSLFTLIPFMQALCTSFDILDTISKDTPGLTDFLITLSETMLNENLTLRVCALEILLKWGQLSTTTWLIEACELLLELVQTPYLTSSARQIEMLIRRLPPLQVRCDADAPYRKLVPYTALSLLRQYHDQTQHALCTALGQMAASGKADDIIFDIALKWLQACDAPEETHLANPNADEYVGKRSDFECTNVNKLNTLRGNAHERYKNAETHVQGSFKAAHQLHPVRTPTNGRLLALQVLAAMSEVAERRSRILTPIFLSLKGAKASHNVLRSDESTSSHTMSPETGEQPWSLRERKAFLNLLYHFENPRVLYRSREVLDQLMDFLTNGNPEVRKMALQIVFKWKDSALIPYQDILLRIAEEKGAITELAQLLSEDEEAAESLKSHDRAIALPVILRLVFGQLIGRSSGRGSQEANRKSILRLLFRMTEQEIALFLEIAQGRLADLSTADLTASTSVLDQDLISTDQQYGFCRMMLSFLEILQTKFGPYGHKIVVAVLYCTSRACRQINNLDDEAASVTSLVRNTRRVGLQCIVLLTENCQSIDWSVYRSLMSAEIIHPRLETFAIETAQGVSVLLRLFSRWAKSASLCHMLRDCEPNLLQRVWHILAVPSARDDVKKFVLEEILTPLVELAIDTSDSDTASDIVSHEINGILSSIALVLQNQASKDVLLAVTRIIQKLAPFADTSAASSRILDMLITLLCEPSQRIPPHIKGSLLRATGSLLQVDSIQLQQTSKNRLYDVTADMYNYFTDQPNRTTVGEVLQALCAGDEHLSASIHICQALNAQSTTHLGEIDFDRRLEAFSRINELDIYDGTTKQWLPIVQNLIFFARKAEDFAIRSNAVSSLKRFVTHACQSSNISVQDIVRGTVISAVKKGVREDSELVRADFVSIYGLVVQDLREAPELEDLKVLLVGGDDEASFFTNILHIQQHRRLRAIRRLVSEIEQGHLDPANISGFFLPLLEKFIKDESTDESAQSVKGQGIASISILLQWVDWKNFRRIFRQYKQDLVTSPLSEKDAIKLLSHAADALVSASAARSVQATQTTIVTQLAKTLPTETGIREELKANFIPKLSDLIHHKDEAQVSLRIPIAEITVKLIKLLAVEEIPLTVAPILLDIAQILRSRTQETRDVARNTLAGVVELMGPSSVEFVLKELRSTLTRGYQLHVLGYTTHTILLKGASQYSPGDLDYCIDTLVAVIMDDIFGVAGQEKQNQDYASDMKEVKGNKSFDSMEILARSASMKAMSKLITPFQTLLVGGLPNKQARQVDELLRRVGVGIAHNVAATSRDLLVFAYELIQAFYRQKVTLPAQVMTTDEKNRARFIVQLEGARKMTSSSSTSLLYKLARFALDIVRSTISKHPELSTVENVQGFLPIIGDTLIEGQQDVKVSSMRLLATVIKLPLAELDQNATLYVMEAVKAIRGSSSTNEEAPQAALKLVSAILRERRDFQVRDSDVAYLLQRTMPDLEEPDRQGVIFNFIKSVMAREYQLPEVYDLVDKLGVMMVTSQSRNSRDAARGVYVHFLLKYPQSKSRWSKQLKFLVKNLEYQHPEGRQSVMEAIHILVQKTDGEIAEEIISTFFVPVLLRMANDERAACRELAGALLSKVFENMQREQRKTLLEPLRAWVQQTENRSLLKLSLQAWTIYFDGDPAQTQLDVAIIRSTIPRTIQLDADDEEEAWEQQFYALELLQKLVEVHPTTVLTSKQQGLWKTILSVLSAKHTWLQSSATTLLSQLFEQCLSKGGLSGTLSTNHGLILDNDFLLAALRQSVKILKRSEGNQDLADKIVKNLAFLGRYADVNNLTIRIKLHTQEDKDEENSDVSENDQNSEDNESSDPETPASLTTSITAIQYLLDQLTHLIRREPATLTSAAFIPRLSSLTLLAILIPTLSPSHLPHSTTISLLTPLTHMTDPSHQPPRSADTLFTTTYTTYTTLAHTLLETLQSTLGDATYVSYMTEVSRMVRDRRDERRQKRAIERVADPERAARYKKRKAEGKKERRKEVNDIWRKGRRRDLGF